MPPRERNVRAQSPGRGWGVGGEGGRGPQTLPSPPGAPPGVCPTQGLPWKQASGGRGSSPAGSLPLTTGLDVPATHHPRGRAEAPHLLSPHSCLCSSSSPHKALRWAARHGAPWPKLAPSPSPTEGIPQLPGSKRAQPPRRTSGFLTPAGPGLRACRQVLTVFPQTSRSPRGDPDNPPATRSPDMGLCPPPSHCKVTNTTAWGGLSDRNILSPSPGGWTF